jgi:hypothetical protein
VKWVGTHTGNFGQQCHPGIKPGCRQLSCSHSSHLENT